MTQLKYKGIDDMKSAELRKRLSFIRSYWSVILIVIAGCWLFNPFPLYFLNDDFIHIPLSKEGVLFQRKSFRPVCDLSVALDYFFWQKNAIGYHLTNLMLHIADSVLLFLLAKRIFSKWMAPNALHISLLAALLFFVYPFHSETVYWILGRSASLGLLFFLPALFFYLLRNERRVYFLASLFFLAVGLLTYESVWVFPLIAILISLIESKQSGIKKEAWQIVFVIGLFLLFLIIRNAAIGEIVGNYEAAAFKNFAFKSLLENAVRLFVRSFVPPVQSVLSFYFAGISIVVLLCGFIFTARKNKARISFIVFFIVSLLLSIIPYLSLGIDTHGTEGERFLYLPSVFVCLLVSYFIINGVKNKLLQKITIVLAFSYCMYFSFQAQRNYATASQITKATILELRKLANKQRLFIDSLPQECNGAVIFRLGFYEAVEWMKPSSIKNIFVSSALPNINLANNNFKVVYQDNSFLQKQAKRITDFNQTSDAVFVFSDTALTVVK